MTGPDSTGPAPTRSLYPYGGGESGSNLADILERVLDKGIVIVGDIKINLLDIELLTVKLRLLVASVDKAKEIGIDWWERDPELSSRAGDRQALEDENERLRDEVKALRRRAREAEGELPSGGRRRSAEKEIGAGSRRERHASEGEERES